EGGEVVGIDLRAAVELPDQRAEPVTEFRDAADEVLDLRAGLRQHFRGHDPLRRLGREHEACRRLVAPLGVRCRLLRAVVGAVDLDRADMAAGVFQLAPLYEAGRIEVRAPGRVRPATDAGADAVDGLRRLRVEQAVSHGPSTGRSCRTTTGGP